MCMLIVAMDIGCDHFELIRMPKGHNHADQDGKFGQIWVHTRDRHLVSPQEYADAVRQALKSDVGGVIIRDLFVLPDYVSYLQPYHDKHFGLADKVEYTQHVWRFQRVAVCIFIPIS